MQVSSTLIVTRSQSVHRRQQLATDVKVRIKVCLSVPQVDRHSRNRLFKSEPNVDQLSGPVVLFKTCAAIKFVVDELDNALQIYLNRAYVTQTVTHPVRLIETNATRINTKPNRRHLVNRSENKYSHGLHCQRYYKSEMRRLFLNSVHITQKPEMLRSIKPTMHCWVSAYEHGN